MTNPFASFYAEENEPPKVQAETTNVAKAPNPFSDFYEDENKQPGLWQTIVDRVANSPIQLAGRLSASADETGWYDPLSLMGRALGQIPAVAETASKIKEADKTVGNSTRGMVEDFKNFFSPIASVFSGRGTPTPTENAPDRSWMETLTALPKGIISGVFSPLDAMTGLDAENRVLSEIERKQKMKEGIATVLTAGIGGLVGPAASVLGGTVEGAALGGGFGAVASAGDPDAMKQIGLGLVMGGAGGALLSKAFKPQEVATLEPKVNSEIVKASADNIQAFRTMSEDIESKSLADLSIATDNLMSSKDAIEAAVKTGLATSDDHPFIVQGTQTTNEEMSRLARDSNMEVLTSKDGKHLFLPEDYDLSTGKGLLQTDKYARKMFEDKGIFPGQVVSYNGNRVEVVNNLGGENLVKIKGLDGKISTVDPQWLRQPSDFTVVGLKPKGSTFVENPIVGVENPHELLNNFEAFQKNLPTTQKQVTIDNQEFKLPKSLSGAKPRYQQFELQFNNDFDRAAYIVAGKGQSKAHGYYTNILKSQGFDLNDVIAHGNKIRQNLKNQSRLLKGKDIYTGTLTPDVEFAKLPRSTNVSVADVPIQYSYEDALDGFVKAKGIDPQQRGQLDTQIKEQLHHRTLSEMSIGDRRALIANKGLQNEASIQADVSNLTSYTRSNNYQFELQTGGGSVIRDESGNVIQNFTSIKDLQDFVRQSGQATGTQLDRSTPIPSDLGGGLLENSNYSIANYDSKMDQLLTPIVAPFKTAASFIQSRTPEWLTNSYDSFTRVDARYKDARLLERVYYPVNDAIRQYSTVAYHALKESIEPMLPTIKGMTDVQRTQVQEWLETASIPELETRYQPVEIASAKQLAGTQADLQNVFKFMQDRATTLRDKRLSPEDAEALVEQAKQGNKFTPKEEKALGIIDQVYGMPTDIADVGRVRRLASLYQNPENSLTRLDFANKYQLPTKLVESGTKLAEIFQKYGKEFGITDEESIFNYFTHRRDNSATSEEVLGEVYRYGQKKGQFYAELQRSGLLQDYEKDPFRAAIGYIKSGYKAKYLNPVLDQIAKDKEDIFANVDKNIHQSLSDRIDGFINDSRGMVPNRISEIDRQKSWTTKFLSGLTGKDLKQTHWPDEINKLITISAQAGLPSKGLRDFVQGVSKVWVADGSERTSRVLSLGSQKLAHQLEDSGAIESWSRYGFDTEIQNALQDLGNADATTLKAKMYNVYDKAGSLGMKISAQEYMNRQLRSGLYAESLEHFGKAFKNVDWKNSSAVESAFKKFGVHDQFTPASRDIFLRYINDGQMEQAAKFYAKDRMKQVFGDFGLGENPRGWKTTTGKLAGKFGMWSVHQAGYLTRMASQGSPSAIAARMLRLGSVVGATAVTEHALNVDMNPYGLVKGAVFNGGPVGQAGRLLFTAISGSGYQQDSSLEQLKRMGMLAIPFGLGVETYAHILSDANSDDPSKAALRFMGVRPIE